MIPDEAVEAAADIIVQGDRGACECRRSIFDKHDVSPPCSTRRQAMRTARSALEAAAPHLMAAAWDEGHLMGWNEATANALPERDSLWRNPYRKTAQEQTFADRMAAQSLAAVQHKTWKDKHA